MRLVFLCSGMEPGANGVGDYSRIMAGACAALGHETRLAALRDASAPAGTFSPGQPEARWNDVFRNPGEARELTAWLGDFRPDWVSVQFTPFGFHPRGLGANRARQLREWLPSGARRHVMFHEIWLQPGAHGRWRDRLLGKLQRPAVLAWGNANGFAPECVHTQARLHVQRLERGGVKAALLPVFSNLAVSPCTPQKARAKLYEILRARGANPPQPDDSTAWWLGHFGNLHTGADWDFCSFAREAALAAKRVGRRVCFVALGRLNQSEAAWLRAATATPEAFFAATGPMESEDLSQIMQACDAAFSSTPADIVEKSGAAAAWRTHEIPLLLPRPGAVAAGLLDAWPDPGLLPWPNQDGTLPSGRIASTLNLTPAAIAATMIRALEARGKIS